MVDEKHVIVARGKFYLHSDYLMAVNEAYLDILGVRIIAGSTVRGIVKIIASMKTERWREQLLEASIQKLSVIAQPIPASEAILKYGPPIADFP